MFLTFCAYELVANSSKKLLYNTRPYWYYGIIVPLNLGIVQRRALIGGTAVRFLYCTAYCILQPFFGCTKHYIYSLAHFVTSRYVWLL